MKCFTALESTGLSIIIKQKIDGDKIILLLLSLLFYPLGSACTVLKHDRYSLKNNNKLLGSIKVCCFFNPQNIIFATQLKLEML